MSIADEVHSARIIRGMSQARLAAVLGVDESYVHHLEGGHVKPSTFMATRLAEAMLAPRERFRERFVED